jgi:hypothetical protein
MPRLVPDLDACFIQWSDRGWYRLESRLKKGDPKPEGVMFLCPKCFVENKGPIGTHVVVCWSESAGAPAEAIPGPGRWKMDGTSLHDLTLNADPPRGARSVALNGGCGWHGFVTDGNAA